MKIALLIAAVFVLSLCVSTGAYAKLNAKLTAKIIDENGTAIQGADVFLSFSAAKQGGGGGLASFGKEGLSDRDGLFSDSSETLPLVGVVVDKDGYYRSIQKYEFKSSSMLLNRWEPWNPTIEVVLKKKRNPVAMYQKYLEALPVPILNTPVGYDMEKGDWVAPHGNGVTSDLVFNCTNNYVSFSEANTSCDISFL